MHRIEASCADQLIDVLRDTRDAESGGQRAGTIDVAIEHCDEG